MNKKIMFFNLCFLFLCLCSISILAQDKEIPKGDFDSFPGVSFKIEKQRLKVAAKRWESSPNKNIYLIGYSKILGNKSDAVKRLEKSKNYLINKLKVPSEKIITAYGGSRPELEMIILVTDSSTPTICEN